METSYLKAFLRIAETGSISRAAASLGISQPSLSQQLLRLEDEIGLALFERNARGVTLTEGGRVFREHARQILHATDQAISDTHHLRDEARGEVKLAMPPSLTRLVGLPMIEALAAQAPMVRVRIVEAFTGSIRGWLEAEKIDLGVLYGIAPLQHLLSRALASDELVLIGAPDRFAPGTTVEFSALATELLVAPGRQHGLRQLLEREAERAGIELRVEHETDALDMLIQLAAGGHGLAVLPRCSTVSFCEAKQISITALGVTPLRRSLNLARNPQHVLTHASLRVESVMRQVMARLIAEGAWQACLESD